MKTIKTRIKEYLLKKNYAVTSYNKKLEDFKLVKQILNRSQLTGNEAHQILTTVRNICNKKSGNLAEVGVFKGGTAKLICESKKSNQLYLFDTFEGLPKPSNQDTPNKFKESQFNETSEEEVSNYLKDYHNITILKGMFPKSIPQYLYEKEFIFVHLDVDLYQSTFDCLEFFYPRMEKGGIIISHDYFHENKGVRDAFKEYFKDKPETIIELPESQCLVVKEGI